MKLTHLLLAGCILFALPPPGHATTINFYTDAAAFAAAAGATSIITFQGIAPDNGTVSYNVNGVPPAMFQGVTFPGEVSVGGSQDCVVDCVGWESPFLGNLGYDTLAAVLPGGVTAIGMNIGDMSWYTGTEVVNDYLEITLNGSQGVLENINTPLYGFAGTSGPLGFIGFTVAGDDISGISFDTPNNNCCLALTNFQFGSADEGGTVPEPASLLLFGPGIAMLLRHRRRAKNASVVA